MIPKRLYLKNAIGIKKGIGLDEIEIDFTEFAPGIVGIMGETGSGKSVVIEMCTPYLKLISRDGSLQSHFYGNDALKEYEFEFNGKTYVSKVLIDADKNKIKPYLILKDGDTEKVLNDKISEYNSIVEKMFGDFDSFVHSVFAPQDNYPIISLSDNELKQLFINLFNLNKYKEEYLPYAKGFVNDIDNDIRVERMMIEKYDEEISKENIIKEEIKTLENELEEYESGVKLVEKEKADIENRIKELENKIEKIKSKRQEILDLKEKIYEVENEIKRYKFDGKQKLENIEANIFSNNKYREELRRNLDNIIKNFERYKKILDNKDLIIEKNKEIKKLSDKKNELEKQLNEQNTIKNSIKELMHSIELLNNNIDGKKEIIKGLKNTSSLVDEVPCSGTKFNNTCQLLVEARESKNKISVLEKDILDIKDSINKKENELNKLKSLIIDDIENTFLNISNKLNKLAKENWTLLIKEIDVAEKELEEFETQKADIERKIELSNDVDIQIGKRLEEAKIRYKNKLKELNDKKFNLEDKLNKMATVDNPDIINKQINDLNFELVSIVGKINAGNNKIIDIKSDIVHHNKLLKDIDDRKKEKEKIKERIKDYLKNYEEWKIISKFLKEVPVLEIKVLSSTLTAIVNDLLDGIFDYNLTIDIITEMSKSSGKGKKDVFKILVYNDGDEMLGKYLSGGQKQIVDMAIRMGIETLLSNISTKEQKTTFMDEVDSKLDTERAIKFLDMVNKTHIKNNKYFTFIVSHRTEIKNNIDQKIDFDKWRN